MRRRRRGFTIIELVMVVAILGILLGIITTAAASAIRQARSKKAEACCKMVQAGIETYYAQKGEWPGGAINANSDSDVYVLSEGEFQSMMRDLIKEYKQGNPCLDISGLFVSRYSGGPNDRNIGMDFMTAIHGTKKDKNGQRMSTGEMHFGYPESNHGWFRNFKVVYSIPTDQIRVMTQ